MSVLKFPFTDFVPRKFLTEAHVGIRDESVEKGVKLNTKSKIDGMAPHWYAKRHPRKDFVSPLG